MKCMYCGNLDSKVVDSRQSDDGTAIRRRRECTNCGRRYTTYETVETTPVLVIKNNGNRQAYDPNKIKNISKKIYNSLKQEITSKELGEMVKQGLKNLDEVAYVRFASVYRQFKDVSTFMKELEKLQNKEN